MRAADVFIHSSPHSGSTWLGYTLGSGGDTAFVGELYRAWHLQDNVPCTVCASKGLRDCAILAGIDGTEPVAAFEHISARNGKRVIIESSKRLDWTRQFLNRSGRDTKIIHLIKDPRNRWASLRRREAAELNACIMDWCRENEEILDFVTETSVPAMAVAYDIVAADPEAELPALFRFFNSAFERRALKYWEVEHHGFAANGASSAIIQHNRFSAPPAHFATGDDRFYNTKFGQSFVDERWRAELPEEENEAILENRRVKDVLHRLGYRLTKEGIHRQQESGKPGPAVTLGSRLGGLARSMFSRRRGYDAKAGSSF